MFRCRFRLKWFAGHDVLAVNIAPNALGFWRGWLRFRLRLPGKLLLGGALPFRR